jgi:acyl carrier protein
MAFTRDQVRDEVLAILKPHVQGAIDLTESSHLVADLGIDSLGVMEVVADLEDKFKLTIPDDALRDVNVVGDVVTAITSRLAKDGRLDG